MLACHAPNSRLDAVACRSFWVRNNAFLFVANGGEKRSSDSLPRSTSPRGRVADWISQNVRTMARCASALPADLLKHLGEQIDIPPTITTLRALYLKRRRALYGHQRWAIELLGMIRFEPTDTVRLLSALFDVVRAGVSGDHLVTATRTLLVESRFVIAGTRHYRF